MQNTNQNKNSTWHPELGWNGLVPGISQVKDAIARLGQIEGEDKFANGKWLQFADKNVQIVVLDNDSSTIAKIRVFKGFSDKRLIPANIEDIQKIYGTVRQTDLDEFAVVTYERLGLRVTCNFLENPQSVKWIEFFPLQRESLPDQS